MKVLKKMRKMARKLKTENGKPQPVNQNKKEEIQELKDEINQEKEDDN